MHLATITRNIESVAEQWSLLAVSKGWARDAQGEAEELKNALLSVAIGVLSVDGSLNAYEWLMLKELFGSDDYVSRAEAKANTGSVKALSKGAGFLRKSVQGFASQVPHYQPEHDPVITVLNQILDAGLAADKFPSEAEALAASRFMTRLRAISLSEPEEPAQAADRPEPDRSNAAEEDDWPSDTTGRKPALPPTPPPPMPSAGSVSSTQLETVPPVPPIEDENNIQALLTKLNRLVGLERVKEEVETLINLAKVMSIRRERGLPSPEISFHLVFAGNPGTGKTTVARILGRIYGELGLLTVGKCIEVDRSALIGQYIGQTTAKAKEVLESSLGSVLFIDEAYSLSSGDQNIYGEEAIAIILKFMEDKREHFVLIAAGYTQEMQDFLNSNPGLRSRFGKTIHFPDYSLDELAEIFSRMCAGDGYTLEPDAQSRVRAALAACLEKKSPHFANAREARTIYERAIERQANRVAWGRCSDDDLRFLRAEDIPCPEQQ